MYSGERYIRLDRGGCRAFLPMRLAQHKGRPFASRPLPGPNPAFNSKSGYLVDERRFQFQLQQNAREDSARTVVHGDSVVVAIIEQSARPF